MRSGSGFLRIGVVLQRTGISRSMLYAEISKGRFPSQNPLGARAVGWIESEVEQWITQRIESSRGPARLSTESLEHARQTAPCA
jgi:prophage regulatory protein